MESKSKNPASTPSDFDVDRFRRSLIGFTVAGIFIIAVASALGAVAPMYMSLRHAIGIMNYQVAQSKAQSITEFLSRAKSVSAQVASRTRARQLLMEFNSGALPLNRLKAQAAPILSDALNKSREIKGITRLDKMGSPVLEIGASIQQKFWPSNAMASSVPLVHGPVLVGDNHYIVLSTPIKAFPERRIGTDIILYSLNALNDILAVSPSGRLGESPLKIDDTWYFLEISGDNDKKLVHILNNGDQNSLDYIDRENVDFSSLWAYLETLTARP